MAQKRGYKTATISTSCRSYPQAPPPKSMVAKPPKRMPAPTSPAADIWVLRQDASSSSTAAGAGNSNSNPASAAKKGDGDDNDDDVPVTGVVIARPNPHRHCIVVNPRPPPMVGRE